MLNLERPGLKYLLNIKIVLWQFSRNMFSSKQLGGQEKSKILSIPNNYKNILEDLVNSLDVEYLAISKQIDLSSNNIPNSKNNLSDPKMNNDLLDRSQEQ